MGTRVEKENEKWLFAFGVDTVTSAFLQIWVQPKDDQDGAVVVIDNQGVRADEDFLTGLETTQPALLHFLIYTQKRFEYSRATGNRHPNLDHETIIKCAKLLGFGDIGMEVYQALD